MPAGRIVLPPYFPVRDGNGHPVSGAELYVYENETTTLATIYTDFALTIPSANPLSANTSGVFPAVFAEAGTEEDPVLYSMAVTDSAGRAPGRPSVFDNYRPSVDYETATLILAEQASESAQADAEIATQALADILALAQSSPEAPSVANKADIDLDNVSQATFGGKSVLPAGASVAVSLSSALGQTLTPEYAGATAGVFTLAQGTANMAALTIAINQGRIIDGGGRAYAINGPFTIPANVVGLRNITFRQVSTNPAFGKSILATGLDTVVLDNVILDLNGIQQTGGFSDSVGIQFSDVDLVRMNRVRVINGGAITGILCFDCDRVEMDNVVAENFSATFATLPTDDVMQGIFLLGCDQVRAWRTGARNLTATGPWVTSTTRRFSRGLVAGGMTYATFDTCFGDLVDQGVDITGSDGNENVTILNTQSTDCTSYGLKSANHNRNIQIIGGQIIRPGKYGVEISQANDTTGFPTENHEIVGVRVVNAGFGGYWPSGRYAFHTQGAGSGSVGRPANINFRNCQAIDNQTVKTMDGPLLVSDVVKQAPNSTIGLTRWIDSQSIGGISNLTNGADNPICQVTGTGTQSVANIGAGGTIILFPVDVYDPSNMHDPTGVVVPSSRIYAKITGWYLAEASALFNVNATGYRQLRFLVNSSVAGQPATKEQSSSTLSTSVDLSRTFYMNAGDHIQVAAYQDSGGAINLNMAETRFSLTLVSEGN